MPRYAGLAALRSAGVVTFGKSGAPAFSSFTDTLTSHDHTHSFVSNDNSFTIMFNGELASGLGITSVVIDPGGAAIACSLLITRSQTLARIWAYEAHGFTGLSGSKIVRITWSSGAAGARGRVQSQSYKGAANSAPTPSNGATGTSGASTSVSLSAPNTNGIIQFGLSINTNQAVTATGGLTETDEVQDATATFTSWYGEKVGSLSGAGETPGASWTSTDRIAAVAFVVNPAPSVEPYVANPVNFDGTNDYLTRGAGLDGAVDSVSGTGSFWVRRTAFGAAHTLIRDSATTAGFFIGFSGSAPLDVCSIAGWNAAGTSVLSMRTAPITDSLWHHIMYSFNGTTAHAYLDGISSLTVVTHTNDSLDYTKSDWAVGASPIGPSTFLAADLADVQMWFGSYLDLSQSANRALFLDGNIPANPTLAKAVLGNPIILLDGATASWHTNDGTGGGFTLNGTLTAGASTPMLVEGYTSARETYLTTKVYKGTVTANHDLANVVIPNASNRVLIDLVTHSGTAANGSDVTSDTLGPGGVAKALTQIADFRTTTATTAEIWRLLEADMPAVDTYTLRAVFPTAGTNDWESFRYTAIVQNANQTLTANGNTSSSSASVTVTVTRASGTFPIGSIILAMCTDGDGAEAYTVTGDASLIEQDVSGFVGGNGHAIARGYLTTAKSPITVTFTLPTSAIRMAAAAVVIEPIAGTQAIAPITIQSGRFYSHGKPWFFTGHFLYDMTNQLTTLNYFADATDATERGKIRAQIAGYGWNSMDILLLNDGDATFPRVSPYTSSTIGGTFDTSKLATWRTLLEELIANNIRPILWMRSDDSPLIDGLSEAAFKAFLDRMVVEFDDLPIMWVLGLEADEYWTLSQADNYGAYLAAAATQPVGIHLLSAQHSYATSSWCQFLFYQRQYTESWSTMYNGLLTAISAIGSKPLVFSEYRQSSSLPPLDTAGHQSALAGAFAGGQGFGTGGPPGLEVFMEALPSGMTASRNSDILTLTGSGVTAQVNQATLEFKRV